MIAQLLALLLLQVGPNPATGGVPGVPDELRDRPVREQVPTPAAPASTLLADCLSLAASDAEAAADRAQAWRTSAANELELAQSAHCLGLALFRQNRFSDALRAFELAESGLPPGAPAYRARLAAMAGNAAMADGRSEPAEAAFARALVAAAEAEDASLASDLQVDRARALVALGRSEEAVTALAAARASDPANARAWLLSATLSRRLERLGEAQQQIEQAATLDPRDPAIGLEAGVIAALSGREDDARRSFESVLLVAPDSDEANRATAYLEQLKP